MIEPEGVIYVFIRLITRCNSIPQAIFTEYEYELEENRTADPGESLLIGGTVDTRTDVLSKPDDLPTDLDNTFTLVAEQYESN